MIKLNLGCSNRILDGFVNIDCQEIEGVDVVCDIRDIDTLYEKNSVDLIYASHILEHFEKNTGNELFRKFFSILKPGGVLRLAVPDFEAICKRYQETSDLEELYGLLYGRHDIPYEGHYFIWDLKTIDKYLKNIGFKNVILYDWRKTEHASVDDFSQAYLPHMNKETGLLMSLNVEATK